MEIKKQLVKKSNEILELKKLVETTNNPQSMTEEEFDGLVQSMKVKGWLLDDPVVWKRDDGVYQIISGHHRIRAGIENGLVEHNCKVVEGITEEQASMLVLEANQRKGKFDDSLMDIFLDDIMERFDVEIDDIILEAGFLDDEGLPDVFLSEDEEKTLLIDNYLAPPFSYLDTRQGYWQERKKHWMDLIGDNAEARMESNVYRETLKMGNKKQTFRGGGVSILDPVLSEVVLKWFNVEKGKVFDCFAGDTVFGFVSGYMGHEFTGIELRQEQVDFNQGRVDKFNLPCSYFCDDAVNTGSIFQAESQDFFFSCPPYFDLEKYSDLENDASNVDYDDFLIILEKAFQGSCRALKKNRFAVVVMSNVRDKNSAYRDITGAIKRMFVDNGLILYNEIILLNNAGTAPLRATGHMLNRKVVRLHQEVMVFYKGDPKKIKDEFKSLKGYEDEV